MVGLLAQQLATPRIKSWVR